jgi:hypothetical protein
MGREKSKWAPIVKEYLEAYGEDMSNSAIAKKIKKENPEVTAAKNSLRFIAAAIRKKQIAENCTGVKEACQELGVNPNDAPYLWLKGDGASIHVRNPAYKKDDQNQFMEELIASLAEHSPVYPKIKRIPSKDSHLLVIDPADIHVGKLAMAMETGEDYNSQIAVQRVKEGVQGILDKSSGFNIDKIIFVGGNDVLHIDTPGRKTTSGTPQDTDGMWYSNFLMAKQLYTEVLEMLLPIAPVHFTFNPSNHDYMSGFMLAQCIETHFRLCKEITFDCSIAHRKYYTYYDNLIGTSHGDGAKQQDLPLIMANESKDWSNTKHRYIYTHHVHHKTSKDYHGCTVESLRSPSGTDAWHHKNGYGIGGVKAVEGFLHHPQHGQIARLTHIF